MNEVVNPVSETAPYQNIFIVGAGAWGTALANIAARAKKNVTIWALEEDVVASINQSHENTKYLKGYAVEKGVKATTDINDSLNADCILIVTPAQHMKAVLLSMPTIIKDDVPFVICSKGIDLETGKLLSTVLQETCPDRLYAVLSGPSFAGEAALGKEPTAVTIAAKDKKIAKNIANSLSSPTFRPYITDDPVGAQICGAVKNVMAIACGVMHGRKMGDNAKAAFITRGLQEIWTLGSAMGTERKTLMGMSGIGDLILTCSSMQSRNFSLGVMLGEGKTLDEILAARNSVTEGVHTAEAVLKLAKKHAVDMPIAAAVHGILSGEISIDDAVGKLLSRPIRDEN